MPWSEITTDEDIVDLCDDESNEENNNREINVPPEIVEITDDSLMRGLLDVQELPRWADDGTHKTRDEKAILIDKEVKQWANLVGHSEDYQAFWNTAKLEYPYLARTATVAYGVVISTACVESLFSEIQDISGDKRSRLRIAVIEALQKLGIRRGCSTNRGWS